MNSQNPMLALLLLITAMVGAILWWAISWGDL